jgi:hypothetical protein
VATAARVATAIGRAMRDVAAHAIVRSAAVTARALIDDRAGALRHAIARARARDLPRAGTRAHADRALIAPLRSRTIPIGHHRETASPDVPSPKGSHFPRHCHFHPCFLAPLAGSPMGSQ